MEIHIIILSSEGVGGEAYIQFQKIYGGKTETISGRLEIIKSGVQWVGLIHEESDMYTPPYRIQLRAASVSLGARYKHQPL